MSRPTTIRTELDLVPIMNLVTILIPFLLIASSFASLAVIPSVLPAIGPGGERQVDALELKVHVGDAGFRVEGNDPQLEEGAALLCRGPCRGPETYDLSGLTALLADLKKRHQAERSVILVPDAFVSYELLIATMDAARMDAGDTLFPEVVIAGGT
ncbi:MAG: biopolymer transporter ExbD [Myxococcota bacterium]